jgi:hypothetical protein
MQWLQAALSPWLRWSVGLWQCSLLWNTSLVCLGIWFVASPGLLGCDAVQCRGRIPTLRRTLHSTLGARLSQWYSTGYGLDDRGFESQEELRIFLFTTASRLALGLTQPPIQWAPGVLPLGVKRPGREADYSPPSSADVKNAWNYTSTPPINLRGVVPSWEKAGGQLYFYLYFHSEDEGSKVLRNVGVLRRHNTEDLEFSFQHHGNPEGRN